MSDSLHRKLDAIIELQNERMFILTGFFLPLPAIELLRPELEADEPPVGCGSDYAPRPQPA